MVPVPKGCWSTSGLLVPVPRTFGTGTTLTGIGTNMRSLQDLSGIPILVQGHACLLIPTSRSLMRIVFEPTLGQNWGSSDSRVLTLTFGVFSHIFLGFSRVK